MSAVPAKKKSRMSAGRREYSNFLNFFAEVGLLKHVKRSGWWVAGIKDPENVAEHSFRCAVMAYFMAHAEGADPYRTLLMALFNDIHETRINDLHKMGHYYIDFKTAERKVFDDQLKNFSGKIQKDLRSLRTDYEAQQSLESLIARDADILECLLQAKEYDDRGHKGARKFFQRAPDFLKTATARKLWTKMKRWDSFAWWAQIVKFDR